MPPKSLGGKQQVKFLEEQLKQQRASAKPEEATIHQESAAGKAPNTVLRSVNILAVKEKV